MPRNTISCYYGSSYASTVTFIERVPTLKLALPGFLNIFTEAAASVAPMVATPLQPLS